MNLRTAPRAVVLALAVTFCSIAGSASCRGSNPVQPTPSGPSLSCPANLTLELIDTPTVPLLYATPPAVGGAGPVTVTCTPPSGNTDLGPGETEVVCTATDGNARTAQCSFGVSVGVVPRLEGTKIVAFGDSMTWGQVSNPVPVPTLRYHDPVVAYPTQLQALLRERYTSQADAIQVINEGVPGEQVIHTLPGQQGQTGEGRIDDVVDHHEPDVLLVLEGVNGLTYPKANDISEGLRRGVQRARRLGTELIVVSTILPGVDGRQKPPDEAAIERLNAEIREWAPIERVVLVDAYASFAPERAALIGEDGLHPTPAGYTRLAELFFEAIRANFELPPPAAAPAGLRGLFASPANGLSTTSGFGVAARTVGEPGVGPIGLAAGRTW